MLFVNLYFVSPKSQKESTQNRGKIKKGIREGKWTGWYPNGQLSLRSNYKNGKLDGLEETYYENGQLWNRKHYKNGKSVGKWKYYNEDGTLDKVIDCDVEDC